VNLHLTNFAATKVTNFRQDLTVFSIQYSVFSFGFSVQAALTFLPD